MKVFNRYLDVEKTIPTGGTAFGDGFCIAWQDGNIPDNGINGAQVREVITAIIERFKHFENSKFACDENKRVIALLTETIGVIDERTNRRKQAGIEGTYIPDKK